MDGISIADGDKMADSSFVNKKTCEILLHVQAKVHLATASISVKFRVMKEDIDISKR